MPNAALLALRAVFHARVRIVVAALSLAAVLAPLLLMYGIKTGVVEGLVGRLRSDPKVLEVRLLGHAPLAEHDIEAFRALPEVGFVIGTVRSISSRMEFARADSPNNLVKSDLSPTDKSDPLTEGRVLASPDGVFLSEALAVALNVRVGDAVFASALRGGAEEIEFRLFVEAILPASLLNGNKALVQSNVLTELETFLDGYAIPARGIGGKDPHLRTAAFASLRLYARTIEDLESVDAIVRAKGFRAESNAANIRWIKNLDAAMAAVFTIISASALIGYLIGLSASLTGLFEQMRPHLSLLRLLGASRAALVIFPVMDALAIAVLGLLLALAMDLAMCEFANIVFAGNSIGGDICVMQPKAYAQASLLTTLVVLIVSSRLAIAVMRVSPTLALRLS